MEEDQKSLHSFENDKIIVVGIGASAGGIQALKTFFEAVQPKSGMAYVVILHLSPEHESQLAQILQSVAAIPVTQVNKKVKVLPDHAYVVPPNKSLSMVDGHIVVTPVKTAEERRAPIDIFFRTLGESHSDKAAAVVLSGTGADGSMGLKRVKELGGVVFVQTPTEAEFGEMPRNSIATDLVDGIFKVAEIPGKLLAYKESLGGIQLPAESSSRSADENGALTEILDQLKTGTGHDFSSYKNGTINRRLANRLSLRGLNDLQSYSEFVRGNPDETRALLKNLLISVTSFFRDKETFNYLEKEILPRILSANDRSRPARVWVAGCATGEEAYSIAMLMAETRPSVMPQIFATDIDDVALAKARQGFYTVNDAADVSEERLHRFFVPNDGGFRVKRELRETILFANHNALRDPPFARIDLVSCRNLLIYLNHAAQQRLMQTFHFSLVPKGYLFLGTAETVDGETQLFSPVGRQHHVYQRRQAVQPVYPVPTTTSSALRPLLSTPELPPRVWDMPAPTQAPPAILHKELLEQYTPSVLVNTEFDIVHMSDNVLPFLRMKGGEFTQSLLDLVRDELRLRLRTALYQAVQENVGVDVDDVAVALDGRDASVNIRVRPMTEDGGERPNHLLVLFEEVSGTDDKRIQQGPISEVDVAQQLENEIARLKQRIRDSDERYRIQAEEHRGSNEELHAINEELRSAVEELETSKEELQSLNEELNTVNQELNVKIDEVTSTSNNLNNLVNSTEIGTIFLDRTFGVRMFTPAAKEVFNLIPADIGRHLGDITSHLAGTDVLADARSVLKTLNSIERSVETEDGRKFLLHVLPYRTLDDQINGVVLTFYDVTDHRSLEESQRLLASIVESSMDSIITIDLEGAITSWNKAAERLYGYGRPEVLGEPITALTLPVDLNEVLAKARRIEAGVDVEIFDTVRLNKDGREMVLEIVLSPVLNTSGDVAGVSIVARDVTVRRQIENASQILGERYRTLFDSVPVAVYTTDAEGNFQECNKHAEELLGVGLEIRDLKNPFGTSWKLFYPNGSSMPHTESPMARAMRGESIAASDREMVVERPDGSRRSFVVNSRAFRDQDGRLIGAINCLHDISDLQSAEEQLKFQAHLLEAVEQAVIATDADGRVIYWNRFAEKMFGWRAGEVKGKNILDITTPDLDADRAREIMSMLREGQSWNGEFDVKRRDGTVFPAEVSDYPIRDENGNLSGIVGVSVDATERKRAEDALRATNERLRLLIESASDYAIFTLDRDRRISLWNAGAEKVFGWSEEEAVGQPVDIIFTPEDRKKGVPAHEIRTALKKGRAPDERFHVRKDGSLFFASGVMTVIKNKAGEVQSFTKIARDMTDRLKTDKAIHERGLLQRLVAAQEDERRRIARDLHDELGQQMVALRLKLDLLSKLPQGLELHDELTEIQRMAARIDNGVDFLAWELRPAILDDFGLFAALERYIQQWSAYSGVPAQLMPSKLKVPRFTPEVEINLYRIVQEALNNTFKYARAKSVAVMLDRRDDLVVLLIEDDGIGFRPKKIAKRYNQGMGLTSMKERAELIGATFEIESTVGQGTAIYVTLPAEALLETGPMGAKAR
ncbi:MAG TPA: PAS domain S-box protein [Pyrinomonadaceae bacterium]